MHTWQILAFLLLAIATGLALFDRAWVLALIAAGLAAELVPAVFQITS